MIAALVCLVSFLAFVQLMGAYCRSIIASTRRVELSDRVRQVAGLAGNQVGASDFGRLLQLLHLCPDGGDDHSDIRAVGAYYRVLQTIQRFSNSFIPRISAWAARECESCSYFAAVALDRRISYSRNLFTQQLGSRA